MSLMGQGMSFVGQKIITKPSNSEVNLFEENDAHYISLGGHGYAICWINKSDIGSESDQIFVKLFDAKGWPKRDEILVANSTQQSSTQENEVNCNTQFSDLYFPVMKIFNDDYLVIAWAEDMDDVFIQMLDLNGDFIGDRIKSKAFYNLANSREGIEIILDILFSND